MYKQHSSFTIALRAYATAIYPSTLNVSLPILFERNNRCLTTEAKENLKVLINLYDIKGDF